MDDYAIQFLETIELMAALGVAAFSLNWYVYPRSRVIMLWGAFIIVVAIIIWGGVR